MIIVAGTLKLSPDDLGALRPAAEDVLKATRAESGCRVYSFAEDLLEPGLVRIYEEWDSRADLDAHGKSEHIAQWHEALKTVTVQSRDLDVIEIANRERLD